MKKYILSIDQGTTSCRAIIFDKDQNIVGISQRELTQYYPKSGWVEHDATEIWATQYSVMQEVVAKTGIEIDEIAGIGITNQRETTVIWDKKTGIPIYNAIVWQCRRTADICDELIQKGLENYIKTTTGLIVDAYFSATKVKWILDNVEGAREKANNGELCFGTIDSYLVYKLTNKKVHVTDYTNASRTMMYDIKKLNWDDIILDELKIPKSILPEVKTSSEIYGYANFNSVDLPICGIAGDQQAALFGQLCINKGELKNTYGTGCFMLINTGSELVYSNHGLLTTICATSDGTIQYALEGSVFVGGAIIQWLRDELNLISDVKESKTLAMQVKDSNGVYIVPAFTGLGAPHWDMYARGSIQGLTRGSNKKHIVRASLESIAYQSKDLLQAIKEDVKVDIKILKVDGGASQNDFLMQFQSDILDVTVIRPQMTESTALGAAYLAGLAVGFYESTDELLLKQKIDKNFNPTMDKIESKNLYDGWCNAVKRCLS